MPLVFTKGKDCFVASPLPTKFLQANLLREPYQESPIKVRIICTFSHLRAWDCRGVAKPLLPLRSVPLQATGRNDGRNFATGRTCYIAGPVVEGVYTLPNSS